MTVKAEKPNRITPMPRSFKLVDVFHTEPLTGNPLAVVFDAEGLSTEKMQQITRWLNFSETTFLLPPTAPEADYRARIFTLDREMPFAGHPTLGTCHAWLEAGGKPRSNVGIVQECGAGLVPIRRDEGRLAFAAPPLIRSGPVEEEKLQEIAEVLSIDRSAIIDAQWADNGPGWIVVLLASADAVLAVEPLKAYPTRLDIGLVGAYPAGSPVAFELRAIFSDHHRRLVEDPVTGSLNASVAQWLISSGRAATPYIASQGTCVGRAGRIHIDRDASGVIWVGGKSTTLFSGRCHI
jgi:PhzF family phenazine biosynthesis protein